MFRTIANKSSKSTIQLRRISTNVPKETINEQIDSVGTISLVSIAISLICTYRIINDYDKLNKKLKKNEDKIDKLEKKLGIY